MMALFPRSYIANLDRNELRRFLFVLIMPVQSVVNGSSFFRSYIASRVRR